MKLNACVTSVREEKTRRIMEALVEGWRDGASLIERRAPPMRYDQVFAVWGQIWEALDLIPIARRYQLPFLHVDNGYHRSARGGRFGYYRICVNGMTPVLLNDPPKLRHPVLDPYRTSWRRAGQHVLIALPGPEFGRAIGLDMQPWIDTIEERVSQYTDRPIRVRERRSVIPLEHDLRDCWAVVTHSSNVAIDALLAGIPVFVEKTNPAWPVGNLDLAKLECPDMPDRDHWWRSLMAQQFTIDEMRDGTTFDYLQNIIAGSIRSSLGAFSTYDHSDVPETRQAAV